MASLNDTIINGRLHANKIYEAGVAIDDKFGATLAFSSNQIQLKSASGAVISSIALSTMTLSDTYYTTTNTGFGAVPANTFNTTAKYIKSGVIGEITGGALTHGATSFTAGTDYLTDTNTGYAITASNTASVSQASCAVTTAGWLNTTTKTKAATGNDTKAVTKYIKAGSATTPTASGASTSTSLSGTTLTVARSVTPTVSAGWVASGTAGTVTITGTVPTETKTASAAGTISASSGKLMTSVSVPAGAIGEISGGALTHGATSFTAGTNYLTDTDTGYTITASNTASVSQASCAVTTAGWLNTTTKTKAATGDDTKIVTKYIKAGNSGSFTVSGTASLKLSGIETGPNTSSGLSIQAIGTSIKAGSLTNFTAGWVSSGATASGTGSDSAIAYINTITLASGKTLQTVTNNGTISTLAGTGTISSVTGTHSMTLNNGSLNITLGSDTNSSASGSNPKVTIAGTVVAQDGALINAETSSTATYLSNNSSGNFGPILNAGWNSSQRYVIGGTIGEISGGALTHGEITFTEGENYFTTDSTSYKIEASNTASVSAASCAISKSGWLNTTTKTKTATGNDTKTVTKYIKAGNSGSILVGGINNISATNATISTSNNNNKRGIIIEALANISGEISPGTFKAGWVSEGAAATGNKELKATTQYLSAIKITADQEFDAVAIQEKGSGTNAGKLSTLTNNGTILQFYGSGTISTLFGTQDIGTLFGTVHVAVNTSSGKLNISQEAGKVTYNGNWEISETANELVFTRIPG